MSNVPPGAQYYCKEMRLYYKKLAEGKFAYYSRIYGWRESGANCVIKDQRLRILEKI